MSTLIIGSEGSMGKRYQAILTHLDRTFLCVDKNTHPTDLMNCIEQASGFIIATPTDTHLDILKSLNGTKKPILCEKPLTKNSNELAQIREMDSEGMNITMMMQYQMLDTILQGLTYYNYFRHGSDGIFWDCIQLIGLARKGFRIQEDSPIWQCVLNGRALNLSLMDQAYIDFIKHWYQRPGSDMAKIVAMHEKVMDLNG